MYSIKIAVLRGSFSPKTLPIMPNQDTFRKYGRGIHEVPTSYFFILTHC